MATGCRAPHPDESLSVNFQSGMALATQLGHTRLRPPTGAGLRPPPTPPPPPPPGRLPKDSPGSVAGMPWRNPWGILLGVLQRIPSGIPFFFASAHVTALDGLWGILLESPRGGDVGGWVRGGGRNLTERLATRIRRQGAEVLGQFHNLTRRGSLSPPWVQSSRRIFTPDHDSTSADFESR